MTKHAHRVRPQNCRPVQLFVLALGALWVAVVTLFVVVSLSGCAGRAFDCFGEAGAACRSDAGMDSAVHAYWHDADSNDAFRFPDMRPHDTGVDYGYLRDAAVNDAYPDGVGLDGRLPPGWQVLFTLRTTSTDPDTFFGKTSNISGCEPRWDFGDGTVVDGDSAIHKYSLDGEKAVRVLSKQPGCGFTTVKLGSNGLVGDPVAEFGEFTALRSLDLSDNDLTGVSTELGKLTKLTRLDLGDIGLTGTIPPEIRQLKEMKTLDLADNPFTGYSPGTLAGLKELCTLDLRDNQLGQAALDAIIDDVYQDRESNVCSLTRTMELRGASSVSPSAAAIDKLKELRESYFWRVYCHGC